MRPGPKNIQLVESEEVLAEKLSQFLKVKITDHKKEQEKEDVKMVEADNAKMEEDTVSPDSPKQRDHKLSESSSIDRISDDEENTDGKPNHSYISLIANAILASQEKRLVLSDIYNYVLDNYSYFRNKGPGWRNSIRHNLSLNECFMKAGRSPNGKGHYWAINPANYDDFSKGDFRRRRAQRRARRAMVYGEFPEHYYPHWSYHPYIAVQRPHPYSSYTSSLPSTYPLPSYYQKTSPTYHSPCTSPTCYSPTIPKKIEKSVEVRRSKRGFDVESLLKDDDDKDERLSEPEIIKRPSTEYTPTLPPKLHAPSPMYHRSTVAHKNSNTEHFFFPEKRHHSLTSSPSLYNNNGRYFSDVVPIPTPSSALLSIDRYRNLYSSSATSKSHHLLQRDLPRISLVQ